MPTLRFPLVIAGLAILLALAAWWGWRDVRGARTKLLAARNALSAIVDDPQVLRTDGGRAAARERIREAGEQLDAARDRLRRSPPVVAAQLVPGLRKQRAGLMRVVGNAAVATEVADGLLGSVEGLAEEHPVQDGRVDIDALNRLGRTVSAARDRLRDLPSIPGGLWGELGEAARDVRSALARATDRVSAGADGIDVARYFLGATGARTHLIAVQNNAEMRDQGMTLSYAIAEADGGRLRTTRSGSIVDLALDRPVAVTLPAGTTKVFGKLQPTLLWQSVNATADFALTGRLMTAMFEQETGRDADGVIALDVPAIAGLLAVVGPVEVPGLRPINADNAAEVLLREQYEGLGPADDQGPRKEQLAGVAAAIIGRITSGTHDPVALADALGTAARGGHFRLYSPDRDVERRIEALRLGGGPALDHPDRTIHLAVQNATAAKLDYYVRPRMKLDIRIDAAGTANIVALVTVANGAPVGARPSFALGPDGYVTKRPGHYIGRVYFWGPRGARQAGGVAESGLQLTESAVEMMAGEERTVVFETVIREAVRDGRFQLRLVPQPRYQPIEVDATVETVGWRVDEPGSAHLTLDRVVTASWRLERDRSVG